MFYVVENTIIFVCLYLIGELGMGTGCLGQGQGKEKRKGKGEESWFTVLVLSTRFDPHQKKTFS